MDARDSAGLATVYEADDVRPHDFDTDRPRVSYVKDGVSHEIDCDFIAGCDGFHGVSRASVKPSAIETFERVYPFGWLGILSDTPPVIARTDLHQPRPRICALHHALDAAQPLLPAMQSRRSRRSMAGRAILGRIEAAARSRRRSTISSPARRSKRASRRLRSFVAEPMRFGRMFLAGDAAHIVPPTGAKGLNLAASDVHYLSQALARILRREIFRRDRRLFRRKRWRGSGRRCAFRGG